MRFLHSSITMATRTAEMRNTRTLPMAATTGTSRAESPESSEDRREEEQVATDLTASAVTAAGGTGHWASHTVTPDFPHSHTLTIATSDLVS